MKKYLSISEMAEIHSVSRQTLIYYDKIGLFKPERVDEHGYRYYSSSQIPFLREICFLKAAGIKLADIKKHIKNRNLTTAISLLEYHRGFINKEIRKLLQTRESIESRLNTYANIYSYKEELYQPVIEEFSERKIVFFPFKHEISRQELHLTSMRAWNTLVKQGMLPSKGFGTMIMKESVKENNIFEGAGAFVFLSSEDPAIQNVITLPAGKYICMYKYGMPYDSQFLHRLLEWINDNHYKVIGNIVDACVLDTTFYNENTDVDLCQLQVPIEKMN
ncbi:DNA-binding transcriptional MerR regulator [Sporomusaceae bacterium BoRhaA]|uniref:MerR family transcriptional regulator n=1 Tax=Pelorhabdus rhamnosifermentans TaxID=2772457 RepID=UPI001C0618C1|nr:MerR family transcriptional regulator [Pelorhabdus rhamnosifermentans]MBU2702438.1 DNA-binding transcriptional MerR regulator [Pelorhabdus rhamnosifermentans]